MKQSTTRRLLDAREAADQIQEITQSTSLEALRGNRLASLGLVKLFEIVGEALNRARKGEPRIEGAVPRLRRYVNLRNQLVHEYDKIDYALVWQTAIEGIPGLLGALTAATGGQGAHQQQQSSPDRQHDPRDGQRQPNQERRPARQLR
jgi:uncharacterized protein with HEPN domain